ncbi:hypothetical protein FNV43_RR17805 [Rhamnella rubrinervis]|uniref:DUF641 domain-containing protein n=1 Tax=Rhamnella rubrinervis TaxID=2594499 RepID=A0A8K0GS96_9ROSA|nr:hypothetical protein FNV43_RR17805 [Rhamnella rubrinervis]
MFPNILLCYSPLRTIRTLINFYLLVFYDEDLTYTILITKKKKKDDNSGNQETELVDPQLPHYVPFHGTPLGKQQTKLYLCSEDSRIGGVKAKKFGSRMSKASNFTDLIQRVAASCLLHPLAAVRHESVEDSENDGGDEEEVYEYVTDEEAEEVKKNVGDRERYKAWEGTKEMEMETMMNQVFDVVSVMKKAYLSLQEAHCPWDPEKMRIADSAMVAELRKLGVLRERFRRNCGGRGRGGGAPAMGTATLREIVAPYEAAVEELKREVKGKEMEVEHMKEKLKSVNGNSYNGKKGRSISKRKVGCSQGQVAAAPGPELFEMTMSQVKEASKSFTSMLLSLMRSAHWDIAAAVRSIEAATVATDNVAGFFATSSSVVTSQHAKFVLESYVSRKIFQGFDHETFYMDGSLSSLLKPDQFRRECFTQYRDMKAMDPVELLGIMPTCHFGKFCFKKYLAIIHPKMEESLFGDLDQHRQVLAGNHPRSQFYGEFLTLAKTVWLLHLPSRSTRVRASSRRVEEPSITRGIWRASINSRVGGFLRVRLSGSQLVPVSSSLTGRLSRPEST